MHFHVLFSSLCNWFLICSLCFLHSLWNQTSVLTVLLYDPASSGTHQHSPPRSKSLEGETASRLFQTRRLQPRLNKPQGWALPSSIAAFRGQTAQTVLKGKQAGRRRGRGTDWGHRWSLADSCCQACGWTKHQFPRTKALAPPDGSQREYGDNKLQRQDTLRLTHWLLSSLNYEGFYGFFLYHDLFMFYVWKKNQENPDLFSRF